MRKAQGALEYLIIIAAVLAIAAIVVLFLTGAFKGASGGGGIAACRVASANCASANATGGGSVAGCNVACIPACSTPSGMDVMTTTVAVIGNCPTSGAGTATACEACTLGNTNAIHS